MQWNNPGSALLQTYMQNDFNQRILNHGKTVHEMLTSPESATGERVDAVPQSTRIPPPLPLTATDFEAQWGRLVPKRFADQIPGATEEQLQALTLTCDTYLDEYEKFGRRNNVASAFAFLLEAGLFAVHDGQELENEVHDTVVQQLNQLLGAAPGFTRQSAQDRQVLYESAIIAGGFAMTFYEAALQSGNPDQLPPAKALARSLVSQMFGRPMEDISVTADGVTFR